MGGRPVSGGGEWGGGEEGDSKVSFLARPFLPGVIVFDVYPRFFRATTPHTPPYPPAPSLIG